MSSWLATAEFSDGRKLFGTYSNSVGFCSSAFTVLDAEQLGQIGTDLYGMDHSVLDAAIHTCHPNGISNVPEKLGRLELVVITTDAQADSWWGCASWDAKWLVWGKGPSPNEFYQEVVDSIHTELIDAGVRLDELTVGKAMARTGDDALLAVKLLHAVDTRARWQD